MAYLGEFCLLPPVTTDQILDISTKRQPRWPPLPSSPPTLDLRFPQNVYWSPCQPLYSARLYILSTELYYNLDVAGQRKTIVRKAAQFITQPLFLFFTKAFSPLTLQVKYGGIKKERKKGSTAIYVESMARKHPR